MRYLTVSVLTISTLLCGCASNRIPPAFKAGDVAIARNFTRYPHYNGTPVTVSGDFDWRWVREAHAMRCYEITTADGQKLAAQPFQLQRVASDKSAALD